jgi:macrolide-specific efflux system membrane fusion protein
MRIGSSVRANIILESTQAQFAIPVQALKEVAGKFTVEVLAADLTAIAREVTVGVVGDQLVEIKSGLTAADQVIIGTKAPTDVLPTQETGPFGEGGNDSDEDDEELAE